MQTPAEIAYRHCEPTQEMRAEIQSQLARLETFGDRITSCRVVVEAPQTRHRNGVSYKITLFIALPQHKDVAVNAHDAPERQHPLVAIREAFNEAIRQVEEAERQMRGQVKQHAGRANARP